MFTDYNQFQGSSESPENVAVLSLIADTSTSDKVDNDLIPSVKLNDETASTTSADRVPILLQSKDASNSERVLSQTPTSITDGTTLSNSERVLSQTPTSITDGTALSSSERVPRPNSTTPGKFVVRYANSLEDFSPVFDYMVKEDWAPAVGDVEVYYSVDPSGCFVGELDGNKIAFLSCLKYSKSKLGSDGLLVVDPAYRGRGCTKQMIHFSWKTLSA